MVQWTPRNTIGVTSPGSYARGQQKLTIYVFKHYYT